MVRCRAVRRSENPVGWGQVVLCGEHCLICQRLEGDMVPPEPAATTALMSVVNRIMVNGEMRAILSRTSVPFQS